MHLSLGVLYCLIHFKSNLLFWLLWNLDQHIQFWLLFELQLHFLIFFPCFTSHLMLEWVGSSISSSIPLGNFILGSCYLLIFVCGCHLFLFELKLISKLFLVEMHLDANLFLSWTPLDYPFAYIELHVITFQLHILNLSL